MEFGVSLPSRGATTTTDSLRLLAQHAETVGLDSIWVSDHIIVPQQIESFYPYHPDGDFPAAPEQDYYEPLTTLTYLAACTTRVQLGTSVLILPYRNALLTAKMVSTLDTLSGGRVILGVGVGWMEEEFEALGLDNFRQRGAVSDEYIRVFRTLWTEDTPSFKGEHVRFDNVGFAPRPVRRPAPAHLDRRPHRPGHAPRRPPGRRLAPHRPEAARQPDARRDEERRGAPARRSGAGGPQPAGRDHLVPRPHRVLPTTPAPTAGPSPAARRPSRTTSHGTPIAASPTWCSTS